MRLSKHTLPGTLGVLAVLLLGASCERTVDTGDIVDPLPSLSCCPTWWGSDSLVAFYDYGTTEPFHEGTWAKAIGGGDRISLIPGPARAAVLSPEGDAVAYVAGDRIVVASVDTDSVAADGIEVSDGGWNFFPAWSPDGEWIAYDNVDCGNAIEPPQQGKCGVTIVRKNGTQRRLLAQGRFADWSLDGEQIVYSGVGYKLFTVDVASGQSTLLLSFAELLGHRAWALHPSYSPDGTRILCEVRTFPGQVLYIIDADGRNPRRLVNGEQPSWSPSGTRIAFVQTDDADPRKDTTIWYYELGSGRAVQLTYRPAE